MNSVNIALVGFGFMGSMHAQIYTQLAGARLVGIADPRTDLVRTKLQELGLDIPVYDSLPALLAAQPGIQMVDLCTPLDAHESDALIALQSGRHLFCEKPLASTLAAADRIIAAAKAAGVMAQVGHCIRFWPEYQALRQYVREGRGGRLLSLSLIRQSSRPDYTVGNWANQERRSGGAALDLHIHDTDFALALLGPPRSVSSRATFDDSGPSHIFTLYDYPDVAVSAEGGWNYPPKWGFRMAFQALFEKACIDYDSGKSPTLTITRSDEPPEPLAFEAPAAGESRSGGGNISSLGGYFNELQAFVSCILRGAPPTDATLGDARASLAVAFAEIESARVQRPIAIGANA
ncbi:MAG TPA: Gfo/Idh/MocA family oxidoreductase [Terracidiphilus sp.]|nr:Gfo/Idh/MocA family oxidoreductase [Terracidiphilus sp.]